MHLLDYINNIPKKYIAEALTDNGGHMFISVKGKTLSEAITNALNGHPRTIGILVLKPVEPGKEVNIEFSKERRLLCYD